MRQVKSLFFNGNLKRIYSLISCVNVKSNNYDNYYSNHDRCKRDHFIKAAAATASILTYFTYKLFYSEDNKTYLLNKKNEETSIEAGIKRPDLPNFTKEQVAKHSKKENGIWITYKNGVYDVTEFVDLHPGGEQILLAAGDSIEPFWKLYAQHHAQFVYEILESLRIGNLLFEDDDKSVSLMEKSGDPFASEPKRHPVLIPASEKPFNAETPPQLLVQNFITPNELFYVRNHLPVPQVDPNNYELEIESEDGNRRIKLTFDQLKKLPKRTITATVMCAGNRRSEMVKIKAVKGLNWGVSALGNARWSGVYLRDILNSMGINEDSNFTHVKFEGLDNDPTKKPYGASIPFWKAVDKKGDVLIAYEMNDESIPKDHGYPVRVIVPGVVGARNVKWLKKIIVSNEESKSHWQQNDYKGFSPSTDWDTVDFSKAPAIQELPVTSAICLPSHNEEVTVEDGKINAKGYAWSGGGRKIVRVDISIDGGKTWMVADITHQDLTDYPKHWSWSLWSIDIPLNKNEKEIEIWAKAIDSSYNTQPENFENIWNLRGVLANAYHKVKVKLRWN